MRLDFYLRSYVFLKAKNLITCACKQSSIQPGHQSVVFISFGEQVLGSGDGLDELLVGGEDDGVEADDALERLAQPGRDLHHDLVDFCRRQLVDVGNQIFL